MAAELQCTTRGMVGCLVLCVVSVKADPAEVASLPLKTPCLIGPTSVYPNLLQPPCRVSANALVSLLT
jgi:hypothetical protein